MENPKFGDPANLANFPLIKIKIKMYPPWLEVVGTAY